MKKVLAVLLTLVLVVGMLPIVGVSAVEEGDAPVVEALPINTAEEFLAMDPTGSYTLEADITLKATYQGKFTGTIDGKGHSITISAPIFTEIAGNLSNLTVKGEVVGKAAKTGAIANFVSGGTYKKIINEAKVKNESSTSNASIPTQIKASTYICAAGFFAYLTNNTPVTIIDSANYGDIHSKACVGGFIANSDYAASAEFINCYNYGNIYSATNSAGGIMGLGESNGSNVTKMSFTNCYNSGNVTSDGDSSGGICAYGQGWAEYTFKNCINTGNIAGVGKYCSGGILGDGDGDMVFENCLNTGNVTQDGNYAGGIVGEISDDGKFINCVNTGNITSAKAAAGIAGDVYYPLFDHCINTGTITAGSDTGSGILSYCTPSDKNGKPAPEFYYCVNTGNISGNDCITGITGYFNGTTEAKVVGCYNLGILTGNGSYDSCTLYYSNFETDLTTGNVVDCYYLENSAEYEGHYKGNYNALDAAKSLTAEQVKEANYVWNLTKEDIASGKLCWYMNTLAGGNVFYQTIGEDAAPTTDRTHGTVLMIDGNFVNPATGDNANMIAVVIVAVVALFGMGITAVALKRKVRN